MRTLTNPHLILTLQLYQQVRDFLFLKRRMIDDLHFEGKTANPKPFLPTWPLRHGHRFRCVRETLQRFQPLSHRQTSCSSLALTGLCRIWLFEILSRHVWLSRKKNKMILQLTSNAGEMVRSPQSMRVRAQKAVRNRWNRLLLPSICSPLDWSSPTRLVGGLFPSLKIQAK